MAVREFSERLSTQSLWHTLSSAHASSGLSPVAEPSLLLLPLTFGFSNSGGGELALELDMLEGGRRGVTRGDDDGDALKRSSPPRKLALLPLLWCDVAEFERSSSTARRDGVYPFAIEDELPGMKASCSAFVALRI